MGRIIYRNTASRTFDESDLLEILEVSGTNNEQDNITGALFYGDLTFLQILEREPEELASVDGLPQLGAELHTGPADAPASSTVRAMIDTFLRDQGQENVPAAL